MRNVLYAIGNSGEPLLAAQAERLLDDPSPLVRGAAVWALGRLMDAGAFEGLRVGHIGEPDTDVLAEWSDGYPVPPRPAARTFLAHG